MVACPANIVCKALMRLFAVLGRSNASVSRQRALICPRSPSASHLRDLGSDAPAHGYKPPHGQLGEH